MKLLLVGALGRMGKNVRAAAERLGDTCPALVDIGFPEGSASGEYRTLPEVTESVDVLIDFSFHGGTPEVVSYAAEKGIPAVIATTGHTEEERAAILKAAEKTPIFFSGNMSLGIAALSEAVKKVLTLFPDADVEIVESHHNRKLDAPSGTALMLFDTVKELRPEAVAHPGRSGLGKRDKNEVGIASIRSGNIVGIHEVIIGTDNEQITLKHEAFDRALFADGALRAAKFLLGKPAGLYTMKELLKG